ncbi:MAG: N-6 DNA methylase [Rhizobiaceae bacterium]|nr:N-6 DNA methylase [Rhizobiaceae bacterium]
MDPKDFSKRWLDQLGYSAEPAVLHLRGHSVKKTHPFALEIETLLKPDGAIRARAVFDVEGVPTVVFLDDGGADPDRPTLDAIRKRIWNQNLATVVIELCEAQAKIFPVSRLVNAQETLLFDEARMDGPYSALDVASANLTRRNPAWFDVKARVDTKLLENLSRTVDSIAQEGIEASLPLSIVQRREIAELLMGQVLFVSYLEHRGVVGGTYRFRRDVRALHSLVADADKNGVRRLIDCLRDDFNGDFLGDDGHHPWDTLTGEGFQTLDAFLRQTDLDTGQQAFWNYDFSFIPVELLSGLYETFLSADEQAANGAYYTPRHLAVLTIDQALDASPAPLEETIFDGACGSGILLTTAYRRLIALAEDEAGEPLGFQKRGELLKRSIFGGDTNPMACRVTAFSLYLSLLEGLDPRDIYEAQEKDGTRLPSLEGSNLVRGFDQADFFSRTHGFSGRKFSIVISNPPWAEPPGGTRTSMDDWAETEGLSIARRQIAGAFTERALEFLEEDGVACFILPIGQLLAPTSAAYVGRLLRKYRPLRLTNFGDLQNLLFASAENTCHVFLGRRRALGTTGFSPSEVFEYLVPKADLSLVYGRLTMQSADRHMVQTQSAIDDPNLLVALMWGDANDLAIWARLAVRGRLADFWEGARSSKRWVKRKGIHRNDKSRQTVSAEPLRKMQYVSVEALRAGSPTLHRDLLGTWPDKVDTVVGLSEELLRVFGGPRVLFPDGFSREEPNVRAVYFDGQATFTSSVGVIAGNEEDADLLKFLAAYLRSSLAQYFLVISGWKRLTDRNAVHLKDVEGFPFFQPEAAPDTQAANAALHDVVHRIDEIAALPELEQKRAYDGSRAELDDAIFQYFGVHAEERALVLETCEIILPSVRPRNYKSLDTPIQRPATQKDFDRYATGLAKALTSWRTRMNGRGRFKVEVFASQGDRQGRVGIARVRYDEAPTGPPLAQAQINDAVVLATLAALRREGLHIIPSGEYMGLVPDVHVWVGDDLYVARPLGRRNWTLRQALRDAERIVRDVQYRVPEVQEGLRA